MAQTEMAAFTKPAPGCGAHTVYGSDHNGKKECNEHELHAERHDHPKQFHITCADASFTDKHDKTSRANPQTAPANPAYHESSGENILRR